MHLALYVHPFDIAALGDHGGLSRLRDLGFAELSMATSYHDGRWLTPWNPQRRVRFLEDGCVHFRSRETYGRLQPVPSSEVPATGPSPLEALCADAADAGLAVRAWTVFGHNTRFGQDHLDLCVENAFGDRYPYALCPANADVRAYHTTLTKDLAAHEGLQTIEFEALGQMGIQHSSHHDKKSFTPKELLAFALSACFAPASLQVYAELGHDGEAVRAQVAAFLTEQLTEADAMQPRAVPAMANLNEATQQWVDAVVAVRAYTVAELARSVTAASGSKRRAVQVHPDRYFTGSQLAAEAAAAFEVGDERVLTCYGEGPDQIRALLEQDGARAIAASPRRLCIWPKAPQFSSDEDLAALRRLADDNGIEAIAIYHLGLLPWRTVERVAKMVR